MNVEDAHRLLYDKCGICGCGKPLGVAALIYAVLVEFKISWEQEPKPEGWWRQRETRLLRLIPTERLEYWVLYQLNDAGLLEHGGGVGGSWLTPDGHAFIEAVRKYGLVRIVDWPEHETTEDDSNTLRIGTVEKESAS